MSFEEASQRGQRRLDVQLLHLIAEGSGHGIILFASTLERIKLFEKFGLIKIESDNPLVAHLTDTGKRGLQAEWRWYLEQRIRDEEKQIAQLSQNRAMWVKMLEEHNRQLLDPAP